MKFGIREICDVVLRAKSTQKIGNKIFYKNEPVCYFDTLKTSTLEGSATTVYATGGRGNARLMSWDGERAVTFTMEDALISPVGLAILTGAGLVDATAEAPIIVHRTEPIEINRNNMFNGFPAFELSKIPYVKSNDNTIYVMGLDDSGSPITEPYLYAPCSTDNEKEIGYLSHGAYTAVENLRENSISLMDCQAVLVDYYTEEKTNAFEVNITPDKFGGTFYLEAATLWRDQSTGKDLPAEFIIPSCRVQSNFNFSMSSSGDPSTFTFTMDAFPDYTRWDRKQKVLANIQIIDASQSLVTEMPREQTWASDLDVASEVMLVEDLTPTKIKFMTTGFTYNTSTHTYNWTGQLQFTENPKSASVAKDYVVGAYLDDVYYSNIGSTTTNNGVVTVTIDDNFLDYRKAIKFIIKSYSQDGTQKGTPQNLQLNVPTFTIQKPSSAQDQSYNKTVQVNGQIVSIYKKGSPDLFAYVGDGEKDNEQVIYLAIGDNGFNLTTNGAEGEKTDTALLPFMINRVVVTRYFQNDRQVKIADYANNELYAYVAANTVPHGSGTNAIPCVKFVDPDVTYDGTQTASNQAYSHRIYIKLATGALKNSWIVLAYSDKDGKYAYKEKAAMAGTELGIKMGNNGPETTINWSVVARDDGRIEAQILEERFADMAVVPTT